MCYSIGFCSELESSRVRLWITVTYTWNASSRFFVKKTFAIEHLHCFLFGWKSKWSFKLEHKLIVLFGFFSSAADCLNRNQCFNLIFFVGFFAFFGCIKWNFYTLMKYKSSKHKFYPGFSLIWPSYSVSLLVI